MNSNLHIDKFLEICPISLNIMNQLKIVKKLGEGSFGKVYLINHESENYALKIQSIAIGADEIYNEVKN